ncbi:MAG: three-Cys-motif partner protein TcmP [Thermomicrobiales bacterium]
MFNDRNPEYVARLRSRIDDLPGIEKLIHKPRVSNEEVGSKLVDMLRSTTLVPTLFFIDPWGYKGLSLDLIGNAIRSWGCDCIFFFTYNRINPGISNPIVVAQMNDLFGEARAQRLRDKFSGRGSEERQATIINEFAEALKDVGGKFVLPFEFKSRHGERTSHHIIFVSKAFLGYHLMKEVMFGLSSDDGEIRSFEYTPVKSPQPPLLFAFAKPFSVETLKKMLVRACAGDVLTVWQVYENHGVDTPYTKRHVKDAIRALEAEGRVTIDIPADKRPKRKGEVTLADTRIVTFPI